MNDLPAAKAVSSVSSRRKSNAMRLGVDGVTAKLVNLDGALSKFNGRLVWPKAVANEQYEVNIKKESLRPNERQTYMDICLVLPARNFEILGGLQDVHPTISNGLGGHVLGHGSHISASAHTVSP